MKSKKTRKFILTSSLFLMALASPIMAHSGDDSYGHHSMMGGYWGNTGGTLIFGWLFMLLLIISLILFIIWMIKKIQQEK
jgi:hypothetical protein